MLSPCVSPLRASLWLQGQADSPSILPCHIPSQLAMPGEPGFLLPSSDAWFSAAAWCWHCCSSLPASLGVPASLPPPLARGRCGTPGSLRPPYIPAELSGQEEKRLLRRGCSFQNGKHYSGFHSKPSGFKRICTSPPFLFAARCCLRSPSPSVPQTLTYLSSEKGEATKQNCL